MPAVLRPLLFALGLASAAFASPVANPGLDTDADNDNWPDGWSASVSGATWETDAGNRFLRLASSAPGASLSLDHTLPVPDGAELIEIRWRQRITSLPPSAPGRYVKIDMAFLDAAGTQVGPALPVPSYQRNSTGWENKLGRFPVPAGAVSFKFSPALVRIDSGAYDLDDISLTAATETPPAPTVAARPQPAPQAPATPAPAAAPTTSASSGYVIPPPPAATSATVTTRPAGTPPEIRVQGNRLVTVSGGKEVWLQGVNVPSLEWSVRGERILQGITVAIDEWKANVIRLPVKGDFWFGKGTKHNAQTDGGAAYRKLIDEAIALTASKGAYLVLDLHHYRAPRADDLAFWTDAATRYKNHPAVIFDLLNEPHGTTWEVWRDGGFIEEKKKSSDEDTFLSPEEKLNNKRGFQSPGMQRMLDTVRATGAKNVVVVGGLDFAYDLTGIAPYPSVNGRPGSSTGYPLSDKTGNGIMYASHVYPWKKSWQKKFLDAAAKHPILLGEVGGDAKKMTFIPAEHQENVETWVPAMLGLIQKHRLNWTGWCFHPSASPRMLADIKYTPTSFWGQPAKDALAGKKFPEPAKLR